MSDDEELSDAAESIELEDLKFSLKPRCNLLGIVRQFRRNENIGTVELDVYKHFVRDANEEELFALFDSLGQIPHIQKITIISKGSATQSLPVTHLSHCLTEAEGLQEFRSIHIKWKGDPDDYEVLAAAVGEHQSLKVLQLHVENMDVFEPAIAAAGQIPTLEQIEIQSAEVAHDKAGLASALESLCTSKSLRSLKLIHVTARFEILSSMARLLSANETLQELFIQATELDVNGGMAMAQMLTANNALKSFILQLDKMHGNKIGDAFIEALEMNEDIQYFQIILDGRMSDMKVSCTINR